MRDQEHGATGPEAADHLPYQIERPLVEHRERYIQDQHVLDEHDQPTITCSPRRGVASLADLRRRPSGYRCERQET